jgi:hypothetical protein
MSYDDDRNQQDQQDAWDRFDFETWGNDTASQNGAGGINGATHQTHEEREPAHWVSQGGVLRWEEPGDDEDQQRRDARAEAQSRWAADDIDLPPGAPDQLRLRSLRAWMLRQRQLETEAMGQLLLERRKAEMSGESREPDDSVSGATDSPFELALAEQQAAIEVYEALVESLDEMTTHNGPARALVEYYLWLNERLAMLASAPEAPAEFGQQLMLAPLDEGTAAELAQGQAQAPTARSIAIWQGQAHAALQTRRRIEQVSAPEPED